eukprot:m.171353 g.171353  ORF g.171353 m.171353 type:complete len:321 (-) comp13365_c1_seq1:405-1367(-)
MKRFRKKKEQKKYTIEDFDREGLKWPGKFFGRVPVATKNGSASTQVAIEKAQESLKAGTYNRARKKVKVFVRISIDGFVTQDLKTGKELTNNSVHRITAWYPYDKASDTFGVVVKGEGGEIGGEAGKYSCIVLKAPKASQTLDALKQLLEIIFSNPNSSDDYGVVDTPGAAASASMKPADPSDPGAWKCAECAWWEHAANAECNMCGSPKPTEASSDAGGANGADGSASDGEEVIEAFEAEHDEDEDVDYMNLPGRDEDYMSFLQAKADGKDVEPPPQLSSKNPFGSNNPFAGMDDDDDEDDEDVNVDFGSMFGGKNPWE